MIYLKLLSVIIPVYNVERYVEKCIQSVLYPDLSDYDIILVNDGSTDSSAKILADYEKKYPQLIQVINKQNGGVGSARNAGLFASLAKYVIFPDSDDYLTNNALPEILQKCREDFDICFFDANAVLEDGKVIEHIQGANHPGSFSLKDNPEILFARPNTWNKIYRRTLFLDHDILFPNQAWYEDLSTILKLYIHAEKMQYTPFIWYCYLKRPGSIINSNNLERNLEIIDAVQAVIDYYKTENSFFPFSKELEYMVYYNEFLTSNTRVNLISPSSLVQDQLIQFFLQQFPKYSENKYIMNMPIKYKFLHFLILHKMRMTLHFTMKLNEKLHS